MINQNPSELIARIREMQDELKNLGVKKEHFNFRRLSLEDLEETLDSVGRQLETRKRFLGEK